MFSERPVLRPQLALLLASSCCGMIAWAGNPAPPAPPPDLFAATELPVVAEGPDGATPQVDPPAPAARATPTQNVTINLINRLVARGLLPKEDADELIKQAEQDVVEARAQAVEMQVATIQAAAAAVAAQPAPLPPASAETVRVTYIPEVVRRQMREQIKEEVMAKARVENWAAPRLLPDWVSRIKLFGDIRVRGEGVYFPSGNDNTGAFPNFNAINTGAPFDISGTVFSPQLNVDEDRQRIRLRARFGVDVELRDSFTAGLRIATGENNSPVSTNQSFGLANQGQGGNFSKYAIWLDRGFLKYEVGGEPNRNLAVSIGRFDNPFFSTEIIWDDDVGFDGIGVQAKYEIFRGFTPFIAGGAFPVFNTDFNFASNQPDKFESDDKWLYGAQLGTDWKISKDFTAKVAVAYYHFDNVEGQLSDPYLPLTAQDASNTDNSRPSFAQKGNTYRPIRNIIPDALNNFGTSNQFQYFGLATPFHELALTGRIDYNHFEPFHISLLGEYVKNLAYDGADIDRIAINNRGANDDNGVGSFDGGDTAWIVGLRVGSAALEKRWDWTLGINYRYVETDAVVDGFTDSDFGGGGTNVQGYTLGGALALGQRVNVGLRWMSSNEVAGPPLKNDTLQIDFNGKF